MTRVLRAVSTTSAVMVCRSLIFMMRWIWAKSRWSSRKFPLVMRATAATACVSVKSSLSSSTPSLCQWRVRTKVSSSPVRGR